MQVKVKTHVYPGGSIVQTVEMPSLLGTLAERISTEIMHTKDKQVHDALVKLGWTPPKEDVCPS